MLGRYRIYRGPRPDGDPLPEGVRQDTRKHTRHVLRPPAEAVARYLANPNAAAWSRFEREYRAFLDQRFTKDRRRFDELTTLARDKDVYLGCNCPTKQNPDVGHCHTVLALQFMKARYPGLIVEFPRTSGPA